MTERDQYVELGDRPFARWAEQEVTIPGRAMRWLARRIGPLTPVPAVDPAAVAIRPSDLPGPTREKLRRIVGGADVDESRAARLAHAGGQSYTDIVHRRSGVDLSVPDAVVRPADHDQVQQVLAACSGHRIAVVPYGGGTSVVGGVAPGRDRHYAVITLDLSRLDKMLDLDTVSRCATFGAGLTGPAAERLLADHQMTLGHVPQSFARATLGGYVATRSAGQASTGYGRIDDLVVGLRVATPMGGIELGTGTPNAAGPNLRALFVGSEGAFGALTEVTLRVRPTPQESRYEAWAFGSFADGIRILRILRQADLAPDVVRLADEHETELLLVQAGGQGRATGWFTRLRGIRTPAFCVLGWEGREAEVRRRRKGAVAVLRKQEATSLGQHAGESWRRHRFAGPLQRDTLLDAGILVETLETATNWADLPGLYHDIRTALINALPDTPPLVLSHVSHVYPTGASLYFTVLARALPDPTATIEQWNAAKTAASRAIVQNRGTITHHHAIGRDHAGYLEAEIGSLGVAVLRQVKAALDPNGICNPGVLIPSDRSDDGVGHGPD